MQNIGSIDRILRIVFGLILIVLVYMLDNKWFSLGLIPLLTGGLGFCPLYRILGINTCSIKSDK